MTGPLAADPLLEDLPADLQALRAEVLRLREMLRATQLEKERVLRMVRSTTTDLAGQVRGQTQQLTSLNQLINTINASLDLRQVASTALAGLHELLGVEAAVLALQDSHSTISYFMVQPERYLASAARVRLQAGEGIVGGAVASRQPFVANDPAAAQAAQAPHEVPPGWRYRSVLCQPILARDSVIGAVLLVNKWTGPFTGSDRNFAETVAGSLAVAIENARMYTEAQAQLKALEQTHAELVATQAQLVESAKLASIGQLAAGLAHEINNPIGIILGFTQLIGQRSGDEKVKGFAANMEREALRIRRIVDDLLGFARQAAAAPRRLDVREVIEAALRLVEYQLAKEHIRVVRHIAPEPAWVMADHDQLLQVLMNLLQNARQALAGGGTLTVSTQLAPGEVRFSVADTGPGIAAADLEHIFEPFFTTKPVGQGTGLGLSVSYGIIKRHGGDITVASAPGQGTVFTVVLPWAE